MNSGRVALGPLVAEGNPEELLRVVDGLCGSRDWDGLVELRHRLEEAIEEGRPLWPVRTWVEYRLALEAPGRQAASVLRPGASRFALGPLTEVAASRHTWAELAPFLHDPAVVSAIAQERVLRGEDLRGDERAEDDALGLPLVLASWEPRYVLPVYRDDRITVEGPPPAPEPAVMHGKPDAPRARQDDTVRALRDLVEVWTSESEGSVEICAVRGRPEDAVAALGITAPRLARLEPAEAMAWMAWAAASGGAHGTRRGAALGRFDAWWAAAAATGLSWPPEPEQLGKLIGAQNWWLWDGGNQLNGWVLRLVVSSPTQGWAVALDARDRVDGGHQGLHGRTGSERNTTW